MNTFTVVFLAALILATTTRIWLALRHSNYVRAHRDHVPAKFAERITLAAHQKAADYTEAKVRLGMLHTLLDALVLLAFTLAGGLRTLDNFWSNQFGPGVLSGLALIVSVIILAALIDLPFTLYRIFVTEARFGFNKMTLRLFIKDSLKQALLGAAVGIPIVLVTLWMMQRLGEGWWLYAWLAWMAFNLFLLAVYPTWIAPLFNKFTPLNNTELKERIEKLLETMRFQVLRVVRDGRLTALQPRQRLLHRIRQDQTHRFFDTLL